MEPQNTSLEDNAELITEHAGWMLSIFNAIAALSEQPGPAFKDDVTRLACLGSYLADKAHGFGAVVGPKATAEGRA